jgi:hypothetical protein
MVPNPAGNPLDSRDALDDSTPLWLLLDLHAQHGRNGRQGNPILVVRVPREPRLEFAPPR